MKTQMLFRQGDVFVQRVAAIPTNLKPVPLDNGRIILAYGEVTGHAHAIVSDHVEFLAADLEELGQRFLRVEAEAQILHEEHGTITLPPGSYQVTRQREHTPERAVYVAD